MKIGKKISIQWPDTKEIEHGVLVNVDKEEVLFQSDLDNTINWVPTKYLYKKPK